MRNRHLPTLAVAVLLTAAGCGGSNDSAGPAPQLTPAEQVETSRTAAAAITVALGKPGALPDGVTITFTGPLKVTGDQDSRWLAVNSRVENHGDQDAQPPNVGIVCAGDAEQGTPVSGSTLELAKVLPARTYRQGTLLLLLPGDARLGTSVPACKAPAYVAAVPLLTAADGSTPTVRLPLPKEIVQQLNTTQPAGPSESSSPATTTAVPRQARAGAFCAEPGAAAITSTGRPLVCSTTSTDDRYRWRSP